MELNEYFLKYPYAEIVSQDGLSKIMFCAYSYAYPDDDIGYDADWQRNFLYISIPAFRVEIDEIMFQGSLLEQYAKELSRFSNLEIKELIIEPLESYLSLEFSYNSQMKVIVKAVIEYPLGWGAKLEFEFETDLTYIDKFICGLQNILLTFPPR